MSSSQNIDVLMKKQTKSKNSKVQEKVINPKTYIKKKKSKCVVIFDFSKPVVEL